MVLRDISGKVVGACDSLPFDIFGRRPWPSKRAAVAAEQDVELEPDEAPGVPMAQAFKNWNRLR
jgi:hypothetical protein